MKTVFRTLYRWAILVICTATAVIKNEVFATVRHGKNHISWVWPWPPCGRCTALVLCSLVFISLFAGALMVSPSAFCTAPPESSWLYQTPAGTATDIVVANLDGAAGLETLVVGKGAFCVDPTGALLWENTAPELRGICTAPAVALNPGGFGGGKVAVAGLKQGVSCLDSATGEMLWNTALDAMQAQSLVWADLNEDQIAELIVGIAQGGVLVLDENGQMLWRFDGVDAEYKVQLQGSLAVADVDGDARAEIFGTGQFGPFCVDSDGYDRWRMTTGDLFGGDVAVADADADGIFEVYCRALHDSAVYAIDAVTGDVLWKTALPQHVSRKPSSKAAIALGDLDGDQQLDIVVEDGAGWIYALSAKGEILWRFEGEDLGNSLFALADINQDGAADVVVTSPKSTLFALSGAGEVLWRYTQGVACEMSPVIADVNGDGDVNLLTANSTGQVACLRLATPYRAATAPWPMQGANPARTAAFRSAGEEGEEEEAPRSYLDTVSLMHWGGFDVGKVVLPESAYPEGTDLRAIRAERPRGWRLANASAGAWELDAETKFAGKAALKMLPKRDAMRLLSEECELPKGLSALSATVMAKGEGAAQAVLQWGNAYGVIREDALSPIKAGETGWTRFSAKDLRRPSHAQWAQLSLTAEAGSDAVWWDEAKLKCEVRITPEVKVFVNQVGYDIGAPKKFTAYSAFLTDKATFSVLNSGGERVLSGELTSGERILGAYKSNWGGYYWRGDLSDLNTPGTYQIEVQFDEQKATSLPFEIAKNLIWERTFPLVFSAFAAHRCGTDAAPYHAACHLDDAANGVSLAGGWHDGGRCDKTKTAQYLYQLAHTYCEGKTLIEKLYVKQRGENPFLKEMQWGAEYLLKNTGNNFAFGGFLSKPGYWGAPDKETDNESNTGDERRLAPRKKINSAYCAAALAGLARYYQEEGHNSETTKSCIEQAELCFNSFSLLSDTRTEAEKTLLFSAAMDLFQLTKKQDYVDAAKTLVPEPTAQCFLSYSEYDAASGAMTSMPLNVELISQTEAMLKETTNPFGVYPYRREGNQNFFNTPENSWEEVEGNTGHLLAALEHVAGTYRFYPAPQLAEFIYDQLNWLLGNNPYGISLIEGAGSRFAPSYVHVKVDNDEGRNAVPGLIANGFVGHGPGDDSPWFDMSGRVHPEEASNGCTLENNARYLNVLVKLMRVQSLGQS